MRHWDNISRNLEIFGMHVNVYIILLSILLCVGAYYSYCTMRIPYIYSPNYC